MDGKRFDDVARSIASGRTRRDVARMLLGGAIALAATVFHRGNPVVAGDRPPRPERRQRRCRAGGCGPGEACQNGACVSCWPEKISCNEICVDPLTDRANCGDCGIVCADGEVCGEGFCGLSCVDHCDCPDDLDFVSTLGVCFGGGCSLVAMECLPDQPKQDCCKTADDLFCVDWRTDPKHCGRCYNDCGEAGCCDGECCR